MSWQALVVARVGQSADTAQKSHIEAIRSDLFWYQSARFQYLLKFVPACRVARVVWRVGPSPWHAAPGTAVPGRVCGSRGPRGVMRAHRDKDVSLHAHGRALHGMECVIGGCAVLVAALNHMDTGYNF